MKETGNEYMWNEHVLTCPSNLDTGLCAGVQVKLPHLSSHAKFGDVSWLGIDAVIIENEILSSFAEFRYFIIVYFCLFNFDIKIAS